MSEQVDESKFPSLPGAQSPTHALVPPAPPAAAIPSQTPYQARATPNHALWNGPAQQQQDAMPKAADPAPISHQQSGWDQADPKNDSWDQSNHQQDGWVPNQAQWQGHLAQGQRSQQSVHSRWGQSDRPAQGIWEQPQVRQEDSWNRPQQGTWEQDNWPAPIQSRASQLPQGTLEQPLHHPPSFLNQGGWDVPDWNLSNGRHHDWDEGHAPCPAAPGQPQHPSGPNQNGWDVPDEDVALRPEGYGKRPEVPGLNWQALAGQSALHDAHRQAEWDPRPDPRPDSHR